MPKPFVMVNLDRPHKLRYTTNALVSMEEILSKPIGQIVTEFSAGLFGFKDIRAILWAGMLHEDPKLTPEQVGDMIDEAESFAYVVQQVGEALRSAFGGMETEEKNVTGPAAGNGTGTKPLN